MVICYTDTENEYTCPLPENSRHALESTHLSKDIETTCPSDAPSLCSPCQCHLWNVSLGLHLPLTRRSAHGRHSADFTSFCEGQQQSPRHGTRTSTSQSSSHSAPWRHSAPSRTPRFQSYVFSGLPGLYISQFSVTHPCCLLLLHPNFLPNGAAPQRLAVLC